MGQALSDRFLLGRHRPRVGLHERHVGAVAGIDLGQLTAHRTPAQHHQPSGQLIRRQGVVAGPHVHRVDAVERRDDGLATGRDQQTLTGKRSVRALPIRPTAAHLHHAGAGDPAPTADDHHALLLELLGRLTVVPVGSHLVAPADRSPEGRGVLPHRVTRGNPADAAAVGPQVVAQMGAPKQRLAGHAGQIGALPADEAGLDDGDGQALLAQ